MPLFTLQVNTDGSAFYNLDGHFAPSDELARLLDSAASNIRAGREYGTAQTLRDINGNDCGQFFIKGDQGECLTVAS